jgi:RNA polymerase sigma-70 factor, ECF subfamily
MIPLGKYSTDEVLLSRIKHDDSGALKILFEKYFSPLCFFSNQFVKNTDNAEEAVSDVFLNIWLKRGKIEIKSSLKAYLYTAVRNQSLNYLKRNKIHYEDIEAEDGENLSSDLNADLLINYEELKHEIDILLRQLPKKREIVFRMNRIDGMSYKEIAEILSISVNTVQNQMVKAAKFISDQYPHIKKLFVLFPTIFLR